MTAYNNNKNAYTGSWTAWQQVSIVGLCRLHLF